MIKRRPCAIVCLLVTSIMMAAEARISSASAFVSHIPLKRRTTTGSSAPNVPNTWPLQVTTADEVGLNTIRSNLSQLDPWNEDNIEKCRQLWELSAEECIKLSQLHDKLSDMEDCAKNNPFEVIRFLREYKGGMDIAETKFRAMVDWRREQNVDMMLDPNEYLPPSLYRYFPAGVLQGVDYDGDPIHVERTGAADSKGLLDRYGREEMLKHAIWIREIQSRGRWHKIYEDQQGHPVKEFTVILDMKGLKMKNMGPALMSVSQEVSRLVQDYYPSYAKRVLVIRAPAIFQFAFNALKPFIDQSMREKIVVASGDCRKVLEKYMDLTVLPTVICSEGHGQAVADFPSVVWEGGDLPKHEEVPPPVASESVESAVAAFRQGEDRLPPVAVPPIIEAPRSVIRITAINQQATEITPTRTIPSEPVWFKRQLTQFQSSFTDLETPPYRGPSYSI